MENQIQELQEELATLDLTKAADKKRATEIDKAIAEFQSALEGKNQKDNKPSLERTVNIKLPSTTDIVGEIVSFSPRKDDRDRIMFYMLDIQDIHNKTVSIPVNPSYYEKIKESHQEGDVSKVSVEHREAGKTGYLDPNGVMIAHTKDGDSLANIVRYSKLAFLRDMRSLEKDKDLEKVLDADKEAMMAVATFLGHTYK